MSEDTSCTDFYDNYAKLGCNDLVEKYEKAILKFVANEQKSGKVRVFGSDLATIGWFVNRYTIADLDTIGDD